MTRKYGLFVATAALALTETILATRAYAGDQPSAPAFKEDGTVVVPSFDLPPSDLLSPEALASQVARAKRPAAMTTKQLDIPIATMRSGLEMMLGGEVKEMVARYPVDIADSTIAGVPVKIVTPKGGKYDHNHILLNFHGGAFSLCAQACALLESAPIAATGGYKVITVNYRMAPEFAHPAGVEDAAAVYKAMLKSFSPKHIGIYGCSAGGALTAELAAWLPAHGLPQAGAAGIFGAGGVRFGAGDSSWVAAYTDGSFPAPAKKGEPAVDLTRGYFKGADMTDAMISPAFHPETIAKFPPTLLITGTRAMDMSPAIYTNSQLLKAGVRSTLIVGEGMGHCYIYQPNLPEAKDARAEIVAFFKDTLK
jgi:acetyl esterase/lipase